MGIHIQKWSGLVVGTETDQYITGEIDFTHPEYIKYDGNTFLRDTWNGSSTTYTSQYEEDDDDGTTSEYTDTITYDGSTYSLATSNQSYTSGPISDVTKYDWTYSTYTTTTTDDDGSEDVRTDVDIRKYMGFFERPGYLYYDNTDTDDPKWVDVDAHTNHTDLDDDALVTTFGNTTRRHF